MLIMIASDLLYPIHLEAKSEYAVLANSIEIEFIQHSPIILEIPFKEGTNEISIVGGFYPILEDLSMFKFEKYRNVFLIFIFFSSTKLHSTFWTCIIVVWKA